MDKLNIPKENEGAVAGTGGSESGGLRALIGAKLREAKEERRKNKLAPVLDIVTLLVGLLFSRCHVIFGAHPLAIAFIAVLPSRVWLAALGAAVGALSLGKSGLIYAMISAIVLFLRMIVSGTDKRSDEEEPKLFHESILLRLSAALIGGFIAAVYETLLSGFSLTAVSFGATMILLPPACAFALSGLFVESVDLPRAVFTREPILSLSGISGQAKYEKIFFQSSALLISFLVSLSLAEYSVFGINISYIYAGAVTLIVARRFGALRAGALGFVSTLCLSSVYSVAFALAGLAAGALFSLGWVYAFIGGGAALGAWCAYAGGLSGFLSVFPEYMIAALLSAPAVRKLSGEWRPQESAESTMGASDMLGTMSLSYKSKYAGLLAGVEPALSGLSSVMRKYSERSAHPTKEEYRELAAECVRKYCTGCTEEGCDGASLTDGELEYLGDRLALGADVLAEDFPERLSCSLREAIASATNRAAAILAEEKYKLYQRDTSSEDFALVAKLLSEARAADRDEKTTNGTLTSALTELLPEAGIFGGTARVLGTRRPYFLIACEDESRERISSGELIQKIEEASGCRLGKPEYYRRGRALLMECSAEPKFRAEYAIAGRAGEGGEVSGDTARCFECEDGRFFSLLSDGMGRGREAKEVSLLVADTLSRTLEHFTPSATLVKILNHLIARRSTECSATVDLFSLDLISGEAAFLKGGAAASYIKRGASLFRIRSKTAPLGLMKTLDAERIRAEIRDGDVVVMLSDGVSQNVEDTPWLIELLSSPAGDDLDAFAGKIIEAAGKHRPAPDDMTVIVTKITAI